jgi:GDPmannose 4,6-dehydratase
MAFEDADGQTALRKRQRGGQTGDSRADNRDVDLFHGRPLILVRGAAARQRLDRALSRLVQSAISMAKRALVTGITGQDGSYLAELLLDKGYEVYGMMRRSSAPNVWRIEHLLDRITLKPADLLDQLSLLRLVDEVRPAEIYNLAAMSFVPASWDQPLLTGEFNSQGVTRLLDAVRQVDTSIRIYQASSSEMFGKVREMPQTEKTPFYPRSPYGVSKVFAHYITVNYRESYNLFAVSGMLFNHESPRRGLEFVTRKVSDGVARIKLGLTNTLSIGNLDAQRDWGFAADYVRAMWMMLQRSSPEDYVIATGVSHSVRQLVEIAFAHVGLDWQKYVRVDPALLRPAEVEHLLGDSSKARAEMGWKPTVDFKELVEMMVDADLQRVGASTSARTEVPAR